MKAMIASFEGKHHQDWNHWLPEFHLAISTAVHESTGVSPAVLALGRWIKDPLERLIQHAPTPPMAAYNTLHNHMSLLREVERHVGMARSRKVRYYNVHRRCVQFAVGDLVWIRTHPLSDTTAKFSAKLTPRWKGPAKVEKQLGPNNYRGTVSQSERRAESKTGDGGRETSGVVIERGRTELKEGVTPDSTASETDEWFSWHGLIKRSIQGALTQQKGGHATRVGTCPEHSPHSHMAAGCLQHVGLGFDSCQSLGQLPMHMTTRENGTGKSPGAGSGPNIFELVCISFTMRKI
ncbi:hypothetical protein MHYP_G00081080 [Metynnis hypsauchen]